MAMFSPQKNREFDDGRIGFKAHFATTLNHVDTSLLYK